MKSGDRIDSFIYRYSSQSNVAFIELSNKDILLAVVASLTGIPLPPLMDKPYLDDTTI